MPSPITPLHARQLADLHGSPLYVYDRSYLQTRGQDLMDQSSPFGLTVRYAIKANPHSDIITQFNGLGLHFDASSSYEAENLLQQGIPGYKISLSSQQPAHNLMKLFDAGVTYVATSLHQLQLFAIAAPKGSTLGLRINAGFGSGHNNRTKTAGVSASFGIWHEQLETALEYARGHDLIINRLHTHIGSGADPRTWEQAIIASLAIARRMPDVTSLDMGGGYKVKRFDGEQATDMNKVIAVFNNQLEEFKKTTGRELNLEIEPGTWLVAGSGYLLSEIIDIVDTGADGFTFLKTNTGMNDFLRPTLYGAQHAMYVLNDQPATAEYVVVGHTCESGDILTTAPGDSEQIKSRTLNKATIGDLLIIADTGAYGASLRAIGYNAFPPAQEVFV